MMELPQELAGTPAMALYALGGYLVLASLLAFAMFAAALAGGDDDGRLRSWRVLVLSLLGGWPGARLAVAVFGRGQAAGRRLGRLLDRIAAVALLAGMIVLSPAGEQVSRLAEAATGRLAAYLPGPLAEVAAEEGVAPAMPTGLAIRDADLPRRFGPGDDLRAQP
jgi:hypothetical protein